MEQISEQVKSLVLEYFSMINAQVSETNGLFDIIIPSEHERIFRKENLKITFDENKEERNYELVLPGSSILSRILNQCLDFGPVVTAKLNSNQHNSPIIRFYFYAIFESVKSKTELIHVDVDIKTQKIVDIDESDINFENNPMIENIPADVIDDCFIEVVDHVEKIMKVSIQDFKNEISVLMNEEMKNINSEYEKRQKEIQDKSIILQSKGESGTKFQKVIDDAMQAKNNMEIDKKSLNNKYKITIDFALASAIILIND